MTHAVPGSGGDIRVYWRPGCSSCAKLKDYLTSSGVDFVSVDVAADPSAMAFLSQLGIRSVPVVVRGTQFSFAQSLDDVARFLNLARHTPAQLNPEELVARWLYFLRAGKALVARVPAESWLFAPQPAVTLLGLSYHIFRIPLSFLACLQDGVQDWVRVAMEPPPPQTSHRDLVELADRVIGQVSAWWAAVADKSCSWPVTKYDGVHSAHVFLERQVWHCAHHARQVADALTQLGIEARDVIDASRYVGLPLPERIW